MKLEDDNDCQKHHHTSKTFDKISTDTYVPGEASVQDSTHVDTNTCDQRSFS